MFGQVPEFSLPVTTVKVKTIHTQANLKTIVYEVTEAEVSHLNINHVQNIYHELERPAGHGITPNEQKHKKKVCTEVSAFSYNSDLE